jgi:phenylacetate-CoA ligase
MRRMEKVTGRSDDMLIIRGVNLFPSQIEELILKDARLAPHYQLEVDRAGSMDTLTVNVEARDPAADAAARDVMAKELAHHIKSMIGVSATVSIQDEGAVERSVGKAKRVVDRRPKG